MTSFAKLVIVYRCTIDVIELKERVREKKCVQSTDFHRNMFLGVLELNAIY